MDMINFGDYVLNNFDGILAVGDVHADLKSLRLADEFAKNEHLFLLSLGDLVDSGSEPYETVELMHSIVYDGRGGMIVGNHDDKFRRYTEGASVRFSRDSKTTLEIVDSMNLTAEFFRMYNFIIKDSLSGLFKKAGDFYFMHGGFHTEILKGNAELSKEAKSRLLFGQTNGEYDQYGYPVRIYPWVDSVPMGKTVVVGHDHHPLGGKMLTEPLIVSNSLGGRVMFLDTGCGKGGHLSGAIFIHNRGKFNFDKFVSFKNDN